MSPPKPIGLHVRLTPEQAATLDRLIADGGDPEATRSRIVRGLIDRADRFDLVDAIESIVESQKALDEAAAKEHPEHGFTEQAYIAYSEAVAERDAAIYLAGRLAKSVRKSPILHSCTNAAPCPRCST